MTKTTKTTFRGTFGTIEWDLPVFATEKDLIVTARCLYPDAVSLAHQDGLGWVCCSSPFTQAELEAGFNLVRDPADWKASINAEVAPKDLPVVLAAIEHMTATTATVAAGENGRLRVTSVGYRMGPAGP